MKRFVRIFIKLVIAATLLIFFLKLRTEDYNFVLVGKIILAEISDRLIFLPSLFKFIRESVFIILVFVGLLVAALIAMGLRRRKGKQWFLTNGVRIATDFMKVYNDQEGNPDVKKPFYYIISTWRDPKTGQGYEFESPAFYQEPKVREPKIMVYLDPKNKKKYFMDTSFLDE